MTQIPLDGIPIIETVPEPAAEALPPATTIYLVAAWHSPEANNPPYWKVHRGSQFDEHPTREAAEEAAKKLSGKWRHRRIIEVNLA